MSMLVYQLARVWGPPNELWSLQVAGNTVRSFPSKDDAVQFSKKRVCDLTSRELRAKLVVYRADGSIEEEYSLSGPSPGGQR